MLVSNSIEAMGIMNGFQKKSHRKMPGEDKSSAPTPHPKGDKFISTNAPSRKEALKKDESTPAPTKTSRVSSPTMKPRSTKNPTKSPDPTFVPTFQPTNTAAPTASPTDVPVDMTLAPTHLNTNSPITKKPTTSKPVTQHPTQIPTDSPTTQVPTKQPTTLALSQNVHSGFSSAVITSSPPSTSAQFRVSNSSSAPIHPNTALYEKIATFGVGILVVLSLVAVLMNKRRVQARSSTENDKRSQEETRKPDLLAQMASSMSNFSIRSLPSTPCSSVSFPTTAFRRSVASTMIPWPNISWPPTGVHVSTSVCLPNERKTPEVPTPSDVQEAYPDHVSDFYDDTSYANTNDYDLQTVFSVASQSIIT